MNYFDQLASTLQALDAEQLDQLEALVRACKQRRGVLWVAGNGGSFAVAQHWAADLSKAGGMRCAQLGANGAELTAWANDTSYAQALAMELMRFARPEDALVCLSCSGTSPNIVTALRQAWLLKLPRVLITRAGGVNVSPLTALVEVPTSDYRLAEDVFAAIGHDLIGRLA